jgi:cysteine desulfurase
MTNSRKIYLDHNSTTPVDRRVVDVMLPFFTEKFGNASSVTHAFGWDAEEAVNQSRERVANLIGASSSEIIFTSGATEAIDIAMVGVCEAHSNKGNHIVTCVTEHKTVLDTCDYLESRGFEITKLGVDKYGNIDLKELRKSLNHRTILLSVMHSNNETGVIHPLQKIAAILKNHQALLMTDATQSLGKVPLDMVKMGIDIATFSAHKMYGPKGVGALYLRSPKTLVKSSGQGVNQEKLIRPGTLNVPGIVGFGKACEICQAEMKSEAEKLMDLRDALETELLDLDGIIINGLGANRLPHMTNISIPNIDGSRLLQSLKNLALSQGSACTSDLTAPSYVLKGMGLTDDLAYASLRIGLGRFTTNEEIYRASREIKIVANKLRIS